MVAEIVFHVEVPVERLRKRHFREPLFDLLALVAELVGRVDTDACDDAPVNDIAIFSAIPIGALIQHQQAKTRPAYCKGRNA